MSRPAGNAGSYLMPRISSRLSGFPAPSLLIHTRHDCTFCTVQAGVFGVEVQLAQVQRVAAYVRGSFGPTLRQKRRADRYGDGQVGARKEKGEREENGGGSGGVIRGLEAEEEIRFAMGLEDVFKEAADKIKEVSGVSNDDMLFLYGHFKQATVGDCTTERPGGLFNQKEKMKWDAWNERKGMAKDDAMKAYIAKVDALAGTEFASKI
ncbi:Acyl-CoA-binding protein [Porphyridium purpureum]|uniref:Acyl-CoA-binding protein n=1 Tax=Porphyridium purpureum TaxID=35688 RepID=A0A5J4Z4X2_PORPP|nr:Acyl-CoA-binding protein [Porphyridium purpureum]|eukprot:POR5040..scf295_1